MRARRIGVVARRFYEELPAALMSRGEPRSNLSARERASQRGSGRFTNCHPRPWRDRAEGR